MFMSNFVNLNLFIFPFQLGQRHRETYVDKTGTRKSLDYFMIPNSAESQIKRKQQL